MDEYLTCAQLGGGGGEHPLSFFEIAKNGVFSIVVLTIVPQLS